jgi:hypothetical protein
VFKVTDLTPETVTFTATDTTDGITLTQQPTITFVVPQAASGDIVASLSTNPADGTTADTITVTLPDSLSRPTPGKVVTLSQGSGNSAITAPSPAVTDSNGQIAFSVTDTHTQSVTYTATDVTDGSLPVPGSAAVDFTSGAGGCYSASYVTGTANPAPGYLVNNFASGFRVSGGNQGFSYNCLGAYGMAWDASGNLYVTDWPTGSIYKFGPSGGVADSGHLFATVRAPATGVAIDPAGNMFASEGSVSGPLGDIVRVALSTGTVGAAIASGIECLGSLALLNPSIPALFADDFCSAGTGGSTNVWEVTGIDSTPSLSVYAAVPPSLTGGNFELSVAPDGTLYDIFSTSSGLEIARISNASPPVMTTLTGTDGNPIVVQYGIDLTAGGMQPSGDSQFLIGGLSPAEGGVQTLDLTGSAPTPAVQLTTSEFSGLANAAIGPDGCLYVAGGPTVSKVTNADGTCNFGPKTQAPTLSQTPTAVSPNPAQGASQSFTASLHGASVPAGTAVSFGVAGANARFEEAPTDASGQASFSYSGLQAGTDNVVAQATVGDVIINSNPVQVTWNPGQDTTFLSLNLSPTTGMPGQPVTLAGNLTDVSKTPPVALPGEVVNFALGSDTCSASTDPNGNASCQVNSEIIPGNPSRSITASFAGTADLTAADASAGFTFVAAPENGKLVVTPQALEFPDKIELGGVGATSQPQYVHVFNPKKKKTKLSVTFLGADNTGDFAILGPPATTCDVSLAPRTRCRIALTFTPTAPGLRKGRLLIIDNADRNDPQKVRLRGVGVKGVLDYAPDLLRFGQHAVGTTSLPQNVHVENPNPVPMAFSATIGGDYQIASTDCPAGTLPPHFKCYFGVTFRPTALGPQPGSLTFTDTARHSPQIVTLHGSGVVP